ncbi:hypothetical protein [Couchioplanes caeruleus]|uniref:Uncharacterized protein n=2 Tax=Couchioplanes caeruleus TaxID=56438 RepID=A0A1K0FHB9_9ACTN|nr:hypothetical protein [Couchioplanes caeruleus]OJF12239.1 hypothetical protein BG844_21855 [Couchioplanes caeruleus subsp. caeruleus]ROP32064.1 hypothetical protein EDD30_4994 [Couchioplanes caeruleus]
MTPRHSRAVRVFDFVTGYPLLVVAWIAGLSGFLAAVPALPPALRAVLMLLFILGGPGSAVLAWSRRPLPPSFVLAAVPVTGLALWIVLVTASVSIPWWQPRPLLSTVAFLTISIAQFAARHRVPGTEGVS